jgi:hypothetical protein
MAKTLVDVWDTDMAMPDGDAADVSQRLALFTKHATALLPKLAEDGHKTHTYYRFPTVQGIGAKRFHKKYLVETFYDTTKFALMRRRSWLRSRLDADCNETWSLKLLEEDSSDSGESVTYRELKDAKEIVQWFQDNRFQPEPESSLSLDSPLRFCSRMIAMFKTWRFHSVLAGSPRGTQLKWWVDYSIIGTDEVYGCMTFSRGPKDDTIESEQEGDNGRSKVIVALGFEQDPEIYGDAELVRVSRLLKADEAHALCFSQDIQFFRK